VVALEAALLGLAGGVVGVIGGRALAAYAGQVSMAAASGPTLVSPGLGPIDLAAVAAALALSLAASIGPAIIASRTDPAHELAGG